MPIDFPSSPVLFQQYIYNTRVWFWDGSGWERFFPTAAITSAATLLSGPWIEVGGLFPMPSLQPGIPALLTHT